MHLGNAHNHALLVKVKLETTEILEITPLLISSDLCYLKRCC